MIDNELHPETIINRLQRQAQERQLDLSAAPIEAISLRGMGLDLMSLAPTIALAAKKQFSYIILDAWYRLIPKGMDENSNSDMTSLFNRLDEYAAETGATILTVHHTSKGVQGSKSVTDVGAGAGAQSRAVDAHLVIRQHEDEGAFVVDAACRSFPPLKSFCIRRNETSWERADELDPALIKQERPRRGSRNGDKNDTETAKIKQWTAELFAESFITVEPRDTKTITSYARSAGMSTREIPMWLDMVKVQKLAHFRESRGRKPALFSSVPFTEPGDAFEEF
jgi:hypothetical protein